MYVYVRYVYIYIDIQYIHTHIKHINAPTGRQARHVDILFQPEPLTQTHS